jgi:cytochrome oxidase Cu insertion factor (SCO1/SenC/PrrC family)
MKHKHIKFHEGHITWTGKEKPTDEIMKAFEDMYEIMKTQGKKLKNTVDK